MWDLVCWPGVEPGPSSALGAWSLSHWTIREVPAYIFLNYGFLCHGMCVCVRTINYKLLLPLSLRCGGVYISSLWVLIGFWLFWTMERSRGMLGDFWGWSGKLWRFYPVLLKTDSGKRCCCSVAKSYLTLQTPWTTACQASLFFTISQSLLKFKSIESVMPSNHFILCCFFLLPSIFPYIRVWEKIARI